MAKTEVCAHGDKEFTVSAVPESKRRGPLTMGLLWVTMVTAFPCVLMGFEWHKTGFTLAQVVAGTLLGSLLLLAYALPASHLGAVSGQTYGVLGRTVFGRWGSRLISINLLWIFSGWYAVASLLLADALAGLFHLQSHLTLLAVTAAVLMAFNNFFGFSGVANFARFLAAPILLLWVGYSFIKAINGCPSEVLLQQPHQPFAAALTTISAFVIGWAAWGNEPDYWRYGKAKLIYSAIPMTVALLIGVVIFPVSGWMISHVSGVTDTAAATNFMNQYSFGGLAMIAALVLAASYFAANDSNLYGATNAVENLHKIPHKKAVAVLTVVGAVLAAWLSTSGVAAALEKIVSLNSIILPMPTILMIAEWFLNTKVFGEEPFFKHIPSFDQLPTVRWPALIALLVGCTVGIATCGIIPGSAMLHVGVPPVQAWLAGLVVFVPLRLWERWSTVGQLQSFLRGQTLEAETVPLAVEANSNFS